MAETNFENATLKLLIEDTDGIVTVASLQQKDSNVVGVQSATITLTNAQILTLHGSPAVIIPATETVDYGSMPTSMPKIIAATGVIDALAGAYDTGAKLFLAYGSPADSNIGESAKWNGNTAFATTGLTTDAEKRMFSFIIGESVGEQDIYDNALVLTAPNGTPVGGDASNTLKVTVYYIPVAT